MALCSTMVKCRRVCLIGGRGVPVAVKQLKMQLLSDSTRRFFSNEISIMRYVALL